MTSSDNGPAHAATRGESGLLASADFLRAAFGSLQANVFVADPRLNLIYANDRALGTLRGFEGEIRKAFGIGVDDVVGGSIHRFHRDRRTVERILRNPTALPHQAEFSFGAVTLQTRINGIYGPDEEVLGYVVHWEDVTAWQDERARLSSMLEAINKSQAVIHFAMDGTILDANQNFLAAVGYSLDEIRGRHHRMFVDAAHAAGAEYREFWEKLGRGEYQSARYKRLGKGGREVWIEASYNPIFDLNGRPFKVVKYATDTTKQVLARLGNERIRGMMESVAAGSEELSTSVREISEAMSRSRDTAMSAVEQVTAADAHAHRLTEAAQSMSGIVELINNITGQINLLALNATIESARAGEAGRGFAVVASEVKNLANQAKQATDKIAQEISSLNGISGDVVGALNTIKQAISNVSEYVTSTAAAVEEQSTVTSEMSNSMQRAAAEAAGIAA